LIVRRGVSRIIGGAGSVVAAAERFCGTRSGLVGRRNSHPIPTANHERFRSRSSSRSRGCADTRGSCRRIAGTPTDSSGRGQTFDANGLSPGTRYELRLHDGRQALSEPWPLTTFPSPDADAEQVRLLLFTCAGGHPLQSTPDMPGFLPMDIRRRLLARALSFQPDALVANGDHLYWDQRTTIESRDTNRATRSTALYRTVGMSTICLPSARPTNRC
jgi:hypothetical protein